MFSLSLSKSTGNWCLMNAGCRQEERSLIFAASSDGFIRQPYLQADILGILREP